MAGVAQLVFSEHRKGWFTITRDTTKPNSVVQFVLVNVKNGKLVTFSIFAGSRSHETSRALLKPGRYALAQLQAGVTSSQSGIFLKSPDRAATTALSIHVKGEFTPKR